MKQFFRILIVVLFLITSLGVTTGLASPGEDDPPSFPLFIPLVMNRGINDISISGTVLDVDSNPIVNVTIRDNYGSSAVTDENGEYAFDDLPYGTYTITEVLQTGWFQTYPEGGSWIITLEEGNDHISDLDFGNSPEFYIFITVIFNNLTP